jgi:hypothetical protein
MGSEELGERDEESGRGLLEVEHDGVRAGGDSPDALQRRRVERHDAEGRQRAVVGDVELASERDDVDLDHASALGERLGGRFHAVAGVVSHPEDAASAESQVARRPFEESRLLRPRQPFRLVSERQSKNDRGRHSAEDHGCGEQGQDDLMLRPRRY